MPRGWNTYQDNTGSAYGGFDRRDTQKDESCCSKLMKFLDWLGYWLHFLFCCICCCGYCCDTCKPNPDDRDNIVVPVETSTCKTESRVDIINGRCMAVNGNPELSKRCQACFNAMDDFQRDFILTGPPGKPIRLIFTEVITQNADGTYERSGSLRNAD